MFATAVMWAGKLRFCMDQTELTWTGWRPTDVIARLADLMARVTDHRAAEAATYVVSLGPMPVRRTTAGCSRVKA